MTGFPTEQCRSCDAPIIWAVTNRGTNIPIDAEPSSDGNIRLIDRSTLGVAPQAMVLSTTARFGKRELYTSHFVACPQATQWRRGGAR